MAGKSSDNPHASANDLAGLCRDVSMSFAKGMAAAPFAVCFNLFWCSTAIGIHLFEQMVNASLRALPQPGKDQ